MASYVHRRNVPPSLRQTHIAVSRFFLFIVCNRIHFGTANYFLARKQYSERRGSHDCHLRLGSISKALLPDYHQTHWDDLRIAVYFFARSPFVRQKSLQKCTRRPKFYSLLGLDYSIKLSLYPSFEIVLSHIAPSGWERSLQRCLSHENLCFVHLDLNWGRAKMLAITLDRCCRLNSTAQGSCLSCDESSRG